MNKNNIQTAVNALVAALPDDCEMNAFVPGSVPGTLIVTFRPGLEIEENPGKVSVVRKNLPDSVSSSEHYHAGASADIDTLHFAAQTLSLLTGGLDDFQMKSLGTILKNIVLQPDKKTSLKSITDECFASEDPRIKSIGKKLLPYQNSNQYSRFFEGQG